MKKIKQAVLKHWFQDKVAFVYEFIGSASSIAASFILAITAKEPQMLVVYILYLIGSITMCYAYIRLGMVWSIVLTIWFTIINIVGLIVLLS